MIEPAIPEDESHRLEDLRKLRILDTPPEERFDRITRTACDLFQVPVVLISLVDADRLWFKSRIGLEASEMPRSISFCGHAILGSEPLVVENALEDPRFADNPLVTGTPDIRFYAGMPISSTAGNKLGTLCLIDRVPRAFDAQRVRQLQDIAAWVERELSVAIEIDAATAEMRDSFVRLVSHELRTPVTGIVGALDMLNSGIADGDNLDNLTRIANEGAGRLSRVVEGIVELAQLDASPPSFSTSRIDLRLFLEAAMESNLEAAKLRGVGITLDAPGALTVVAAQQPLVRIVRSLLDNAISFSPSQGKVVVAAGLLAPGMIRISVTDDGPGISPDYIQKLFTPFSQGDTSDSRGREGFGISLAICRRLATAMGGHLGYQAGETGGSCFYLDLPQEAS